jgi:hypothetical protein
MDPTELYQLATAARPHETLWRYERWIRGRHLVVELFVDNLDERPKVVVQTFLHSRHCYRCSAVYADGYYVTETGEATPFTERDTWDYT